jgi:hypothetical protein
MSYTVNLPYGAIFTMEKLGTGDIYNIAGM